MAGIQPYTSRSNYQGGVGSHFTNGIGFGGIDPIGTYEVSQIQWRYVEEVETSWLDEY